MNKSYISQPLKGEKNVDLSYQQNHSRDILLENTNIKDKYVRAPENSCEGQGMP